jgi:hypothetical protein
MFCFKFEWKSGISFMFKKYYAILISYFRFFHEPCLGPALTYLEGFQKLEKILATLCPTLCQHHWQQNDCKQFLLVPTGNVTKKPLILVKIVWLTLFLAIVQ